MCPVVEAFRTDSSYFLHSRIAFDVKQSWERVPLPYLNGEYSKISWFFFMLVCFVHGNNVFKFFLFVLKVETMFLVAFDLFGKGKPCFLVSMG